MALSIPETIRVLLPGGIVRKMPLEVYVRGVVTAALPADAPLEALKAQAVAARTFGAITRRHIERGADVCTLRHCQLWKEPTTPAARRAADGTRGIVAVHDGRLIDAYYFEHCDGNTRDAKGILVQVPPYLRSVTCACGFATLRGHGVGMCQRGAQVMARFGDDFDAILKHYFTGISLERASQTRAPAAEVKAPPPSLIPEPRPSRPTIQDKAGGPEPPAQSSKPRRVTDTTKISGPKKGPAPAPGTLKPQVSGTSPAPSKSSRLPQTPKAPSVIPTPAQTRPADQVESRMTTETAPAPGSAEPAALAEAPKPPNVPLTSRIESKAPESAAEQTKALSTLPPLKPETEAETPATAKSMPSPLATQPTLRSETPKSLETPVTPLTKRLENGAESSKESEPVLSPPVSPPPIALPEPNEKLKTNHTSSTPAPAASQPPAESPKTDIVDSVPPPTMPEAPAQDLVPPEQNVELLANESSGATTASETPQVNTRHPAVRTVPARSQGRTSLAESRPPSAPMSQPPPSMPEPIGLWKSPAHATGRESFLGPIAEDEAGWYPVADDIVVGTAEFRAEMMDEALEAAQALEEPPGLVAPLESRPSHVHSDVNGLPTYAPTSLQAGALSPNAPATFVPPPQPPETMPEEMPVFPVEEEPVAFPPQPPPPPILEEEFLVSVPAAGPAPILIDRLPGPRMIAGDLVRSGTIITIRDVHGHAVVTVSGAAPHYGPGGFEAPLAESGKYAVTFDHSALEIDLGEETVFIQLPG
jgi:Stage II sporulation protein